MAIEQRRGCGWRKVGGIYLCGGYISVPCDRLPLPLDVCPVCGQGVKVGLGFTKVNPYRLWGIHGECTDRLRPCFVCDPKDTWAYIMGVGGRYYKTPQDFMQEARQMGISKRIGFIPKDLVLGETIVYLAHPKACQVKEPSSLATNSLKHLHIAIKFASDIKHALQELMAILEQSETKQPKLLESEKVERRLGIFTAFIPQRIEKLVWESKLTDEERERLEKRGITPIGVPDGDNDHA